LLALPLIPAPSATTIKGTCKSLSTGALLIISAENSTCAVCYFRIYLVSTVAVFIKSSHFHLHLDC
jgi:hypothetical protein